MKHYPMYGKKSNLMNIKFKLNKNEINVFEMYVRRYYKDFQTFIDSAENPKIKTKLEQLKAFLTDINETGKIFLDPSKQVNPHDINKSEISARNIAQLIRPTDKNKIKFLFKHIIRVRNLESNKQLDKINNDSLSTKLHSNIIYYLNTKAYETFVNNEFNHIKYIFEDEIQAGDTYDELISGLVEYVNLDEDKVFNNKESYAQNEFLDKEAYEKTCVMVLKLFQKF